MGLNDFEQKLEFLPPCKFPFQSAEVDLGSRNIAPFDHDLPFRDACRVIRLSSEEKVILFLGEFRLVGGKIRVHQLSRYFPDGLPKFFFPTKIFQAGDEVVVLPPGDGIYFLFRLPSLQKRS